MNSSMHPLGKILLGAVVTTLLGCSGNTRPINEGHLPLSQRFDQNSGTIAVVPNQREQPQLSLASRRSKAATGAAKGAAGGAAGSLLVGCGTGLSGGPFGLLIGCGVGVLAAPFAMVGGAISGADRADVYWSTHDISLLLGAKELLDTGLEDHSPQLAVSREVVSWLRSRVDDEVILRSYQGAIEDSVPEAHQARVVEIRLTRFGLVVPGEFDENDEDPSVSLIVGVAADTYFVSGDEFVYETTGHWEYLGNPLKYSKALANKQRFFEKEIGAAADAIARLVVE